MEYEYEARMQLAAERAGRLADDYARANAGSYRRRARRLLPPAGLERAERARRRAARPQLEA
jgi:hypothetical protein